MRDTFERRQEILSVMYVRRHDTVENLAFRFNVSERTIRRDIEALSVSHPLYTAQGNGGGIHMVEGTMAGRKYLTDEQAALLYKLSDGLSAENRKIMDSIFRTFAVPKKIEGDEQKHDNNSLQVCGRTR
ncbi:hypothetical protein FACS1894211_00990 [Clostridia bacterium]|nr:hypothetical protein FACS1894211_00990 [Clostridia bacterium]